jgi:hypothetical protein
MEDKGILVGLSEVDMKDVFIILGILIIILTASPAFSEGWIYYTDGPYKGKVLDLETGEPIEGAVVAGVWQVDQYGGAGIVIGVSSVFHL